MIFVELWWPLPETNMAPENNPLGKGDSYWKPSFLDIFRGYGSFRERGVAPTEILVTLDFSTRISSTGRQRQTLFFTATWPMSVRKLAAEHRGLSSVWLRIPASLNHLAIFWPFCDGD